VRDAIVALAWRLRTAEPGSSVRWQGPYAERMAQPLEVDRHYMLAWPEVLTMAVGLPAMVREASSWLANRPDTILVGGAGACWPFAVEAIATAWDLHGIPIWQSGNPLEDAARGAAWWPVMSAEPELSDGIDVDIPAAYSGTAAAPYGADEGASEGAPSPRLSALFGEEKL
jgi:hypothetical protein